MEPLVKRRNQPGGDCATARSLTWLSAVEAQAPRGVLVARSLKLRARRPPVERYLVSLPRFHPAEKVRPARFLAMCDAVGARVPDVLLALLDHAVGFHLGFDPDDPERGAVTKIYLEFCGALPSEPSLMYLAAKASAGGAGIERYEAVDCSGRSDWAVMTRPFASHAALHDASRKLLDRMESEFGSGVFDPDLLPFLIVHESGTIRYSIDINFSNIDERFDLHRIIAPFSTIFDLGPATLEDQDSISHVAVGLSHGGEPFMTLYGFPLTDLGGSQ